MATQNIQRTHGIPLWRRHARATTIVAADITLVKRGLAGENPTTYWGIITVQNIRTRCPFRRGKAPQSTNRGYPTHILSYVIDGIAEVSEEATILMFCLVCQGTRTIRYHERPSTVPVQNAIIEL